MSKAEDEVYARQNHSSVGSAGYIRVDNIKNCGDHWLENVQIQVLRLDLNGSGSGVNKLMVHLQASMPLTPPWP